jgi:murein DD-endopeptidase MepM/ murein hydrolase activator NlpD
MKIFLLKAKHFLKRNIYPITVSLCTVLVLSLITVSAYTSIKNSNTAINVNQSEEKKDSEFGNVDDLNPSEPVGSVGTIIFDLPFEKATISKEYTDTKLLYDATTKMWCTHQGIDFACAQNQEVKAVYDGKITKIESSMMNGTVVYLKVSDDLIVVYKGLASEHNLKEGQEIKKGEVLGKVTSFLAEKADGIHLHLELLKANKLIDPTEYFSFNK